MSETTPLLADHPRLKPSTLDVYDRFTDVQKRTITATISFAGIIGLFASACFVPSVPEVAKDLRTTGTVIKHVLTIFAYMLMIAVGNLIWAPYAGFYGRQPVYLASLPLVCIGSLGAVFSQNVPHLLISRTIQALGASCVMSVGPATISDIYKLEQRGTAMGVFFGVTLLGPATAPLTGGILSTYASWRMMQLLLFAMGLTALILIATFLPETSHPGTRGIDLLYENDSFKPVKRRKWRWVWLSPFTSLKLLRGPTIFFVASAATLSLSSFFVLMIPLSYTIGPRYGITSPALIGACFLPTGLGNIVGATIAGRVADCAVTKGLKRRNGQWFPEDRLRGATYSALILIPMSLLLFALTNVYVPGSKGLALTLACLFLNGAGVDMVLAPSATYLVDVLRTQSAEVIASSSAFRNVICAVACAGVLPMINSVGIIPTNAVAAIFVWIGFGLLCLSIRYGDPLRAWLDIGYTPQTTRKPTGISD
ncbi:MFS general substrate transporter [Hysterangium stoloniferum]|nr:MFS general substrate transporter [Hysterangium stoloniferum]